MTRSTLSFYAILSTLAIVVGAFVGFPAFGQESGGGAQAAEGTIEQLQSTISEINARLAVIESSASQSSIFDSLTFGQILSPIAIIGATLLGVFLGGYLSKNAAREVENRALELRKKEATISICTDWIDLVETIASATLTLENAKTQIDDRKLNEISTYGNWLEIVLLMKADNMLDESFLRKFGFEDRVLNFRNKLEAAKKVDNRLGVYLSAWKKISEVGNA